MSLISNIHSLTFGLVVGGFVARLGLEWSGRPWPWPSVVALGLLLAGVGVLAHFSPQPFRLLGDRDDRFLWASLLLVLYLVWPHRQPDLAWQQLTWAALFVLLHYKTWQELARSPVRQFVRRVASQQKRIADFLTFGVSLAFYIATTAPDLLPADSGEFQIVAPLLGVAHPPGYPLYTLLGRLFTLLIPFGSAAYRLNLLSAFLAAGTLTLMGAATRRWARRVGASAGGASVGGLVAALTLGTTITFWAQSGVANIRMPTMFLAALGFYALARYADAVSVQKADAGARLSAQTQSFPPITQDLISGDLAPSEDIQNSQARTPGQRQAERALVLLALALSLGLGHHPSLLFVGVFFFVYLILVDARLLVQPRRWWKPLFVALLALLPLLYLPLRGAAGAPLAPSNLDTLDGFWQHVSAQGFGGDMFAYANAQDLPPRLALLPTLFNFQFNPGLLLAAALGLLLLAWRDRKLLVLLAGGVALHTFVSITYRAPQTVEYLMPAYLPLSIIVGLVTASLLSPPLASRLSPFPTFLATAMLLAGLLNGLDHGPSFFILARDRSTRAAAASILEQAPPEALVLADWHWATPLWYLQWVEDQRPDVEVRYVYPVPGQEYGDTWRDRIEAADDGERPLLLTHAYDLPGYTLEPLGTGFWVHQRPYDATPTGLSPLEARFFHAADDSGLRLLGYRLNRLQPRPGQTLELTLAWQAEALTVPPSFSVQLVDGDGRRLAQADSLLGTDYVPGEVRFERLVLPLYPEISPGNYQLVLETYSVSAEGFQTWSLQDGATRLDLATLPLRPNSSSPPSLHPLSVPFAGGPTLTGVDYDRTLPSTLRLYLHWRGPAQGGEQVDILGHTTRLPPLPEGAYQTVILDLPEFRGDLPLTLRDVDGQVKLAAGAWGVARREVRLPAPSSSARFVPLGDEMALIGVEPGPGKTVAPGDALTLNLTFLALKPLVNDDGVSVRLLDEAGGLRDMHDLQPALGAIPTLKWIRGSRVTDPHPLQVPNDLSEGTVQAVLVVYERFRGTSLRPLDGRMGVMVPLGEWDVVGR